jgi:hypothetical protein
VAVACLPSAVRPTGSLGAQSPGSPTASPRPTGPTPVPSFVPPTATPIPSFATYVVVKGDNLNIIARRFDTTALSISYWNRAAHPSLDPESEGYAPNRIAVGWILVLIPGAIFDPQTLPQDTPLPASAPPSASPVTELLES